MKKLLRILAVLTVLMLCSAPALASAYEPVSLTAEQRAAADLFLSNFTEIGVRSLESYEDDMNLVDFAHDHLWFNDQDSFEYGEYANGNNCRVSNERIQEIIDKYFYYPRPVDLSQTRFDYVNGYYYHCETGGWTPDGFAYTVSAVQTEIDTYFVSFLIFGGGDYWDNSVMDDSLEEIAERFPYSCGYGSALIHAEDLSDRSTYKMIAFSRL